VRRTGPVRAAARRGGRGRGGKPLALEAVDLRAQHSANGGTQERIKDSLRKHVFESLVPPAW